MKKLTLSIAFNFLFVLFFIGKRIYYSHGFAKLTTKEIDWRAVAKEKNAEMTKRFSSLPVNNKDLVFVGSSLTEGFPVSEYFANAKNRGIGGNTVQYVIDRISQVTNGKPKKIFLEIGINDIGFGTGMDTIEMQYRQLAKLIKAQAPNAELFLQSVLPTSNGYASLNSRICELNSYIEQLSKQIGAIYINLYQAFVTNGQLNNEYTTEGLHLNLKGYEVWRDQIERYVNKPVLYTTK